MSHTDTVDERNPWQFQARIVSLKEVYNMFFVHSSVVFSPTPPAGSPNEVHAEIVANHTRIVPWSCSATNGCPGKGGS